MLKAIIVSDNLEFIKKIINIAVDEQINIKIDNISIEKEDALRNLKQKSYDLVFINLESKQDSLEIINKLRFQSLKEPQIILMIKDITDITQYKNVSNILLSTDSLGTIFKKLKQIVDEINRNNENINIKDKVVSELFDMGYNIKLVGTRYLIESIMYICESNNFDIMNNLEQNVYKPIANKHNKSVVNIKTNIAKSTRAMYKDDSKLTPKYVISDILTKVYQNN